MLLLGYQEKLAATPPVNIYQASCDVATDYTKKKYVLRLKLHDGAEFLLEIPSQGEMVEWHRNINKFAGKFLLGITIKQFIFFLDLLNTKWHIDFNSKVV